VRREFNSPDKPRVGITLGDPAGIGPEIVLKSVLDPNVQQACTPVIIGSAEQLKRQASLLGLACDLPVFVPGQLPAELHEPAIVTIGAFAEQIKWGELSAAAGRQAIAAIETAAELSRAHSVDAIATAPINKKALRLAGSPFAGHTEMLAELCGASQPMMCFFAGGLRVFLLTIHTSLATAITAITRPRVREAIILADRELRRFGVARPRIAMAGLNPHAGEDGLFGNEDREQIAPAVDECRTGLGIDVSGPYPPDTIFLRAWRGEFDSVGACYHDQGLIAVKCLAFGKAVNVTLGLPIIRTSVDHGTAFDIAGRGIADHHSMIEAITLAAKLAISERRARKPEETSH